MSKIKEKEKRKMKAAKERLFVYVDAKTLQDFISLQRLLGLTKTGLGNICLLIGIAGLRRLLEPEKVMTTSDWTKLLQAGKSLGVELKDLVEGEK